MPSRYATYSSAVTRYNAGIGLRDHIRQWVLRNSFYARYWVLWKSFPLRYCFFRKMFALRRRLSALGPLILGGCGIAAIGWIVSLVDDACGDLAAIAVFMAVVVTGICVAARVLSRTDIEAGRTAYSKHAYPASASRRIGFLRVIWDSRQRNWPRGRG